MPEEFIGNYIKFCDAQPKIEITCQVLDEKVYKIQFKDNGIGFPGERAQEIFEPFKRLDSRNVYAGSGIGLALCKRIIEKHQGTITAVSAPRQGTEITIHLPMSEYGDQSSMRELNDRPTP